MHTPKTATTTTPARSTSRAAALAVVVSMLLVALPPLAGAAFTDTSGADFYGTYEYDGAATGTPKFRLGESAAVGTGGAASGEFQFSDLATGTYEFLALLDADDDNMPDEGEPIGCLVDAFGECLPNQDVELAGDVTNAQVRFFDGGAPGACAGDGSIAGRVFLNESDPGLVVSVRATNGECETDVQLLDGDWFAGVPYSFTALSPDQPYFVEAWEDENENGLIDFDEPSFDVGPVDAEENRTDVDLYPPEDGGDGGEPGGAEPGGYLAFNGTTSYAGDETGGFVFMLERDGADFPRFEGVDAVGPFGLSGFLPGTYGFFAWMETDGIGGPSVNEPFGFLNSDAPVVSQSFDFSDNLSDQSVTFLDPPEGGWHPDHLPPPPEGMGGGDGGGSGCTSGGAWINGTVFDAHGDVIEEGVFIEIENRTSKGRDFPTIESGAFACELPPGNYRVSGHSPDHGFTYGDVTLAAGASESLDLTLSFDFRPPYERPTTYYGGTVWGNVTVGGAGASGVRVNVFPAPESGGAPAPGGGCEPADPQRSTLSSCGGEGETNSTGGFVITYLPAGTYDMYIDGSGAGLPSEFVSQAITIESADNTTVTSLLLETLAFDAPGYIRGYVTRSSDDGAVAAVDVSAFAPCGPEGCEGGGGWGQTDADGYYSLSVSPGDYGMFAQTGWNYVGPALSPARVDCGPFPEAECITVEAGEVAWRNFTLAAGATISGYVMQSDNATPARAFLNAESCEDLGDGMRGACTFAWGQTSWNETGWFSLVVEPGTYDLRIEPDRYMHPDLSVMTLEDVVVDEGGSLFLGQVAFTGGGSIAGTVSTASGEPVAYANVFAQVHRDDPFAPFGGPASWGFTDGDGAFTIGGLAPGTYDVVVEPGHGSAFMRTTDDHDGAGHTVAEDATAEVAIVVEEGGTLEGYVLTSSGAPVANAFVDAFWMPEQTPGAPGGGMGEFPDSGGWGHSMTDGNGHYAIRGLTDGTFGMSVRPPSGTSYTSENLDPFADELPAVTVGSTTFRNFTLGAAGRIVGCVVADETPVARAWVSAFSRAAGFGGGEPTGNDGCFAIRGVASGTYELEVNPPFGSEHGRARVANVVVVAGSDTDVGDVELSEGTRLAGRVLAADGVTPLSGVFVNAFQITEPGAGPGAYAFGVTDADGAYNLSGLTAGKYGMHVQPPWGSTEHSSKFIPEFTLDAGGRYGYDIELGGGGSVSGTVLDDDGAPLANAWVNAWSSTAGSGSSAITGDDGTFTLTGLAAASDYNVDVFPPWDRQDLAGEHQHPVTVAEGETLALEDIQLSTGGTLVGTVEDADGEPVEFAYINVNGDGTFGWGMTDEDGEFSVQGLAADENDTLTVFVQPGPGASFSASMATVVWAPDADGVTDAGTITLDAGVSLTGVVTRDGVPVEDVEVHAWPSLPYSGPPIGGSATTDENGEYTITGLPEGQTWDVMADDSSSGAFQANATTTSGESTTYDVALPGSADLGDLDVTVLDAADDTPIEGAHVDCFDADAHVGRGGETDASGLVTFTGLPDGAMPCKAFAPGYAPARANATVVGGGSASLTLRLTAVAAREIVGTFVPEGDADASGYLVVVVPSDGDVGEDDATGFTTTGDGGAFTVGDLPPGTYDVKILDTSGEEVALKAGVDLTSASQTITVTAGEGL